MKFTQCFCDFCGQRTTYPMPSSWYNVNIFKNRNPGSDDYHEMIFCDKCAEKLIEQAQCRKVKDIEKVRKDFQKDYLNHPLWFGELIDFI